MRKKPGKPLLLATLMVSTFFWTTACVRLAVIPSDKQVIQLKPGQNFTPASAGYFVPQARMLEILDALGKREIEGRKE